MKEIELKHWLAYSGNDTTVHGSSDLFVLRSAVPYVNEIELHLYHPIWGNCTGSSIEYSLVLHPLSDLTKEIEVNGEKFVPIDKLWFDYKLKIAGLSKYGIQKFIENNTMFVDYFAIELLISWKFDVFGLINNNLAIDINTL